MPDTQPAEQPYERTCGPVHEWFELSYVNFAVQHRAPKTAHARSDQALLYTRLYSRGSRRRRGIVSARLVYVPLQD